MEQIEEIHLNLKKPNQTVRIGIKLSPKMKIKLLKKNCMGCKRNAKNRSINNHTQVKCRSNL